MGQKTDSENVNESQNKYWLSLDQWRKDPQFKQLAEREFMSNPLASAEGEGGWARREFLKLMGASMALTSFGCVRRPAQKIVPYAKRPHDVVMGISNYYASSFVDGMEVLGTLVETREGRPIKVEGNPLHKGNKGGMSARGHAEVLSLYDPDRLNGPRVNLLNEKRTNRDTVTGDWQKMDEQVKEALAKGKTAILTSHSVSPSTQKLLEDFESAFGASVYVWDPVSYGSLQSAQEKSYGQRVIPNYRFERAKYILSVECDFLGTYLAPTTFTRHFSATRKPGSDMSRLVVFESLMSLTGTNADERFRIKSSEQLGLVMALLNYLIVEKNRTNFGNDSKVREALAKFKSSELSVSPAVIERIGEELWENRGRSLVITGGLRSEGPQAEALHIAVNFLNSALGNDGKTVQHEGRHFPTRRGGYNDLKALQDQLIAGEVDNLIIHGVNPAYATPGNDFAESTKKAKLVIYTGDRIDETGKFAHLIMPDHHAMENWSDAEAYRGLFSILQPTIRPLYGTRAFQDSLLTWMKMSNKGGSRVQRADTWYDYLRNYWQDQIFAQNRSKTSSSDFESFWYQLLQEGRFDTTEGSDQDTSSRNFQTSALQSVKPISSRSGYELTLYQTVGLREGRLSNVSWLQEFPDPVTKICWDNYLTMSPADAHKEGIHESQVVQIKVGSEVSELPVHIQPGQSDGVLGLAVGYGRTDAGKVADGVGFNAYDLVSFQDGTPVFASLPVASLKKTGKHYSLANTQGHHSMEGRQIVVEATLDQYVKNPAANIHRHKIFSLWSEHKYPQHKWGMTIDLNTCTGCSACVIACQSENNIPTVGKKYVLQGREMHWIRVDRYYSGPPEDPSATFMPLVCQHCDNAPCETVCPVAATVHSDEGTNDMIYNRCVGTRYCANNCPYKVRRFNWFDYTNFREPLEKALNPEVAVRSRGVMEKCTFCIHRIQSAKIKAKNEDRALKDGDVKTACQQSCPTNAIIFGDLKDDQSEVAQAFKAENSYTLLEELMAAPAVKYQTKIRNSEDLKGEHSGGGHH